MLLLALLAAGLPAAARPELVAHFDDLPGDDHGRGTLVYPTDPLFVPGSFDLTAFEVLVDGDDVLLAATFRSPIQPPTELRVDELHSLRDLCPNSFCLQNVDVYISRGSGGRLWTVPGRRLQTAPPGWDRAVILTPQPAPARAQFERILARQIEQLPAGPEESARSLRQRRKALEREVNEQVLFPTDVRVQGRTITARVRAADLGGRPQPDWGYAVVVTGAAFSERFDLDGLLREAPPEGVFVRPVLTFPDQWSFGDRLQRPSGSNAVDVLTPLGMSQEVLLEQSQPIPFVRAASGPSLPAAVEAALPLPVEGVEGDQLVFRVPDPGSRPAVGEMARLADSHGEIVGRVVVVEVGDEKGKARIVEPQGPLFIGMGYRLLLP